jgi:hypothetical protein
MLSMLNAKVTDSSLASEIHQAREDIKWVLADDKNWITVRIGYFIGELFVEKHNGCWSICDAPNSKYFGHYVIGQFSTFNNPNALFSPMEVACFLVNEAKERSLIAIIDEVETGLKSL